MRRARLEVEGVFYKYCEFKVQADFSDVESALLRDGFINVHPNDAIQVMAGQYKAPFSQEEYIQSSKYTEFVERSMLNNLAPGRSPGVMVHGSVGAVFFRIDSRPRTTGESWASTRRAGRTSSGTSG